MSFVFSSNARTVTVYNLRADTREFIGSGNAYIPPHTGLPANCTDIEPPLIPEGMVAIFNGDIWDLVEDHRGVTVFDTNDGEKIFITQPGSLPPNTTAISTEGNFMKWNGKKWVKDIEAEKASAEDVAKEEKKTLMIQASMRIDTLADSVNLDMASESETEMLIRWRQYRVLLGRIDPANAPEIIWPELPDDVA